MKFAYTPNPDGSVSGWHTVPDDYVALPGETVSPTQPDTSLADAKTAAYIVLNSKWFTRSTTVGVTVATFPFPFDLLTQQKVAAKLAAAQSGTARTAFKIRDLNGTVHSLTKANAITQAAAYLDLCDQQNDSFQVAWDAITAAVTPSAATAAAAAW